MGSEVSAANGRIASTMRSLLLLGVWSSRAPASAAIRVRSQAADALRIYRLNTEVTPNSAFALRSFAGAQLASGDTAGAVASFQKALGINPNDQQSKAAVARLKPRPFK